MIKGGILKKWWFWVAAVVIIVIGITTAYISAKTSSNSYKTFKDHKGNHNRYQDSRQIRMKEYSLNEEATSEGMKMKITAIQKSNGNSQDKPREGMQYIIVSVNIKNTGKSSLPVKLTDFQMRDDFDETAGAISTSINADTQLKSGDIAPGAEVNTSIAFEEPSDTSNLTMLYKDDFSDNRKLLRFKVQ
ncbi:MAG: DUF4352 domain-containing protein [Bacillota bacterium]|nr:DUF4352 domain-containing protein [Bacillota bacterium]